MLEGDIVRYTGKVQELHNAIGKVIASPKPSDTNIRCVFVIDGDMYNISPLRQNLELVQENSGNA